MGKGINAKRLTRFTTSKPNLYDLINLFVSWGVLRLYKINAFRAFMQMLLHQYKDYKDYKENLGVVTLWISISPKRPFPHLLRGSSPFMWG